MRTSLIETPDASELEEPKPRGGSDMSPLELREELAGKVGWPCSEQEFFDSYCVEHLERFGEEFEPGKTSPAI